VLQLLGTKIPIGASPLYRSPDSLTLDPLAKNFSAPPLHSFERNDLNMSQYGQYTRSLAHTFAV